MNKPLEALEYLKDNPYIKEDRYSLEALNIVEQMLKSKAADEICETIGNFLGKRIIVIFNEETNAFEIPQWDGYDAVEYLMETYLIHEIPYIMFEISKFYMERGKEE